MNDKRTPNNEIPITLSLVSTNQKVYRDVFCLECGHPFMALTDKIVGIMDANVVVKRMNRGEALIEVRCKNHYCKQRYNVYVTVL